MSEQLELQGILLEPRTREIVEVVRYRLHGLEIRQAVREERRRKARAYRSWRAALPEACAGMFELNRYAAGAGRWYAREIYGLKDRLIALLYREGYCRGAWVHVQTLPAQPCWECGGTGDEGRCWKCDGDGIYAREREVRHWCFTFEAGGRKYVWHAPMALVKFEVVATEAEQAWDGAKGNREVSLRPRGLARAMRLVQRVVEQAEAGRSRAA